MELDPGRSARAKRTATPLVQAGLALLVAGTLVTFSFLAFRTGFADQPQTTIEAAEPGRTDGRPVLLPSPGRAADSGSQAGTEALVATTIGAVTDETDERVLGTRIGRVEDTGGTDHDTRVDLDEGLSKRSGSSMADEDEGWDGTQKKATEKHGKSNSKITKGRRGLGHHKHGHQEHGHHKKGHAKHHH